MFNLTLKTPIRFGKYEGQTGDEIARRDPQYILWMENNLDRVSIDPSVRKLAVSTGILNSEHRADAFGSAADYGFDPF